MSETEQALWNLFEKGVVTKPEVDEAMLRFFVYGFTDEVEECDLIQRVLEKNTFKKKFPVKFVTASIEHIIHCESCFKYYSSIKNGEVRRTEK